MLNSKFRLMALTVAYLAISSDAVGIRYHRNDPYCHHFVEIQGVQWAKGKIVIRMMKTESMSKWQQEWNTVENGMWTHNSTWVNRKLGVVNFRLMQLLSRHGCFRQYLHPFGNAKSPLCPECENVEETWSSTTLDSRQYEGRCLSLTWRMSFEKYVEMRSSGHGGLVMVLNTMVWTWRML